jgi:NhaP-type Na+/H+ or K+/H+ antiporter
VDWTLTIAAVTLLAVAAFSGRLTGTPVTPAMVFVAAGILAGPLVLDDIDVQASGESVKTLAEATLALVLFSDAARVDVRSLRRDARLPARLLGIGLPLTIAAGALVGVLVFGRLSLTEALVLAVLLAPTDAALGQAVVTEPRLPARIRQGLNVESGLNDGICVPLLLIALAGAEADASTQSAHDGRRIVLEQIGYGVAAGVAVGALLATIVIRAGGRGLIAAAWRPLIPVAGAFLAYGIATPLGGSGFIAAFVAGMTFGRLLGHDPEELCVMSEE